MDMAKRLSKKRVKEILEKYPDTVWKIINKLKTGEVLSRYEHSFCKMNARIFENLRFRKVRKAMKKWQMLKS